MTVPASLSKCAHPPRSNRPRSSSSGPPGPCITPSTETCVVVVSFMVVVPFLVGLVIGRSDQATPRSSLVAWAVLRVSCGAFLEQVPHIGDVVLSDGCRAD